MPGQASDEGAGKRSTAAGPGIPRNEAAAEMEGCVPAMEREGRASVSVLGPEGRAAAAERTEGVPEEESEEGTPVVTSAGPEGGAPGAETEQKAAEELQGRGPGAGSEEAATLAAEVGAEVLGSKLV